MRDEKMAAAVCPATKPSLPQRRRQCRQISGGGGGSARKYPSAVFVLLYQFQGKQPVGE